MSWDIYNKTTGIWYENLGILQNDTWNVTYDHGIGNYTMNVSASKMLYNFSFYNKTVGVFGWSNVTLYAPSPGSYVRNTTILIGCNVLDLNLSTGIFRYPVEFLDMDKFSSDYSVIGVNMTNESGDAILYWDTTTYMAGSHHVACRIADNYTLYYTAPDNTSNNVNLDLKGKLYINITDIEYDIIYRNDSFAPYSTNFTYNITDELNRTIANTTVYLNYTLPSWTPMEKIVDTCNTTDASNGTCVILFDINDIELPDNYTLITSAEHQDYTTMSNIYRNII